MPNPTEYMEWGNAGGPNECKHGYAAGIPCPCCDRELVYAAQPSPQGESAASELEPAPQPSPQESALPPRPYAREIEFVGILSEQTGVRLEREFFLNIKSALETISHHAAELERVKGELANALKREQMFIRNQFHANDEM